jgi:Transposase IS66 family
LADIAANARRGRSAAEISPIALEAVKRIDALFDIERGINSQSAEERLRVRREQSAPLVAALEAWLCEQLSRLSNSSAVAGTDRLYAAARINDHAIHRLDELLPWNWAAEMERRKLAA